LEGLEEVKYSLTIAIIKSGKRQIMKKNQAQGNFSVVIPQSWCRETACFGTYPLAVEQVIKRCCFRLDNGTKKIAL
jgi:hypothetical protein